MRGQEPRANSLHATTAHRFTSQAHTHTRLCTYTHARPHTRTQARRRKRRGAKEREGTCKTEEDETITPPRQRSQSRMAHRAAGASRQALHRMHRFHHRYNRSVRDASVSPQYGASRKASTRKLTRARPPTLQSSPPSLRERRDGCLGSASASCATGDS